MVQIPYKNIGRFKKEFANPAGTVLIMMAFLIPLFIIILGMITDIGRALVFKAELNRACMIASEEATKQINMDLAESLGENILDEDYGQAITEYFSKNIYPRSARRIEGLEYEVSGGVQNPGYIRVRAAANIDCFFLKIIGINSIKVHSDACGRLRSLEK